MLLLCTPLLAEGSFFVQTIENRAVRICACLPELTVRSVHPRNSRPRTAGTKIDTIVLHAMSGHFEGTIREFERAPQDGKEKSAHYLVSQRGSVTQMVPEAFTAFHATSKTWNDRSIGIELEDGSAAAYLNNRDWATDSLYESAAKLVACVATRYSIKIDPEHIKGHSDVASRDDPGPHWNWQRFFRLVQGFGGRCSDG